MTKDGRLRGRRLQARRALALQMFGTQCAICKTPVDTTAHWLHPNSYTLDHRIPLALGGSDDMSNLQVTHRKCNAAKGAKLTTDRNPSRWW